MRWPIDDASRPREAEAFFVEQDEMSAPQRVRCLKAALRTMIHVIARAPATGLPHVREYIVEQHVVLYAHSDSGVVQLALKLKTSVDRSPPAKPVGHAGPTVDAPPTMPLGGQRAPINGVFRFKHLRQLAYPDPSDR